MSSPRNLLPTKAATEPARTAVAEARGSLTRRTLLKMATRITLVLVVTTAIGYSHLVSGITSEMLAQLSKYVVMRGQRERGIFTLAEDNVAVFKAAYLERLKASAGADPKDDFDRYVIEGPDGVYRNPREGFDTQKHIGAFIGRGATINADLRRRVVIGRDLLSAYGPAWHNRFQDTYIDMVDNIVLIHWPGVDWAQSAPADLYVPNEEYIWAADEAHNPARKTVWTGLYFDVPSQSWMISCVAPVDLDGRYIGVVGHDIVINELLDRTINDRLDGTYNLIFRGDGRLIAHPHKMEEIKQKKGNLLIDESSDENLKRIYRLATGKGPGDVIVNNEADGEYLAVAKLDEPDYYLITIFPKAHITQDALAMARIYLLLGLLALVVEIVIMYYVLRRQITAPLSELVTATERVRGGDLDINLDAQSTDELGHLAGSFNAMARQIELREQNLRHAEEEATRLSSSLARTNEELAQSLARSEEAARLKGEFLANISHELRTPLNAILNIPDGLLEDFTGAEVIHCGACSTVFEREPGEELDPKTPCPECGAEGSLTVKTAQTYHGDPDETVEHIRTIARAGSHLLHVVNDVLDFSKLDAGRMTLQLDSVSVAQLFADVSATIKPLADKSGIALRVEEVDPRYAIHADPIKCAQILLNLLANAVKFSEAGTVIELGGAEDGADFVFHVRDHGIGIAPEHQSLIFESFRQVDGSHTRKYGGTGLGLAITQKLVTLHGGRIWVESKLGEGSTFYVRLGKNQGNRHEED